MRYASVLFLAGALWVALTSTAAADAPGGPSTRPVLRIECGVHSATLNRIAVDAGGRVLVSGSSDKTVRVWALPDGTLLKTLRPPVADGDEGKIYAVAITPDGRTVACAGATGSTWGNRTYCIYLFDRESGGIKRRIPGLPAPIRNLAFSPDGQTLVACLEGPNGIRLFRTADGAMTAEDRSYREASHWAAFASGARKSSLLVTTCIDGFIRLYRVSSSDGSLHKLAQRKGAGGTRPAGVAFSPDAKKVAVGYLDAKAVDILSVPQLALQASPETADVIDGGSLDVVTWSTDGHLYAGGSHHWARRIIRTWDGAGRPVDVEAADGDIVDLRALPGGGVAYGASSPSFGVLSGPGKVALFRAAPVVAFGRQGFAGLGMAPDGSVVQVRGDRHPGHRYFHLGNRALQTGQPAGLIFGRIHAEGLQFTVPVEPVLDGRPLVTAFEGPYSVAVAHDGKSFLLGSTRHLRLFSSDGSVRWKKPAPDGVWDVNLTADGRVAVVAFADGTIRWYRLSDGQELLALFLHKDGKRWITWTASGYYDCSLGGEDLIGWHVNRAMDEAADFFPASRLRGLMHRPAVVDRILATCDEKEALRMAEEAAGRPGEAATIESRLPPVVRILSPADGSRVSDRQVLVRYGVRTPSGEPVTSVRVLLDGRPLETARDLTRVATADSEQSVVVQAPPRDCTLSVIVSNRFAASEAATVRLRWAGAPQDDSFSIQPKLYILAVGVSTYPNPEWVLRFPAKDVQDFCAAMQRQKGLLYRDVVVKLLVDGDATRNELQDGLDWIRKETTSKDVAMVYLSGHGINDMDGSYYFVPYNFNPDKIKSTGLPGSDIRTTVGQIAGKCLFFFDSCHAGNVMGTQRTKAVDSGGIVNELVSAENGAVVFTACTGRQTALEDNRWRNGAFTLAVLEGLGGKADYNRTGRITVNMLDLYISERVKELTGGRQSPTTAKPATVPDFPVSVVR